MYTHKLQVVFQGTNAIQSWVYENLEEAQIELDKLKEKMGRDYYNKVEEENNRTHMITSKCGNGYVVPRLVAAAGIVVIEEHEKAITEAHERNDKKWFTFAQECMNRGIPVPRT